MTIRTRSLLWLSPISVGLHDDILRRVIQSELRDQLNKNGCEVSGRGPETFRAFIKREPEKAGKCHQNIE